MSSLQAAILRARAVRMEEQELITLRRRVALLEQQVFTQAQQIEGQKPTLAAISLIKQTVGKRYGVTPDELTAKQRVPHLLLARHVALYLCREQGHILKEISKQFHRQSHGAICHAVTKIRVWCGLSTVFADEMRYLKRLIEEENNGLASGAAVEREGDRYAQAHVE